MTKRWRIGPSFEVGQDPVKVLQKVGELKAGDLNILASTFSASDFFTGIRGVRSNFSQTISTKISSFSIKEANSAFSLICAVLEGLGPTEFDEGRVDEALPPVDFSETEKTKLYSLFREVHKDTNFYDWAKARDYKSTGPFSILSVSWAVDLRGIMKKRYQYQGENIVDYEPEIERCVPMVMLEVSTENLFQEIALQVDEEGLDELINQLLAAQKELIEIKKIWEDKNA